MPVSSLMKPTKRPQTAPRDSDSAADEQRTAAFQSKTDVPDAAEAIESEVTEADSLPFLTPPKNAGELGWLAHYRVRKLLGQGGMGMVFLAEDTHLKRAVALKVIRPEVASESTRKRFLREARACAAEENDHIVTIYQVSEERGVPFMAMQYLKGTPLNVWLKQGKQMPLRDVLRIGKETARGLAAAHEHGLIHRDIKPGNLWLEAPSGRVKILDFGLARPVEDDEHEEITQTGNILGTPGYMAPEQANSQTVDGRSDLFSLGCVLYELAAGQKPFQGKGALALLMALAKETPRPVIDINPSIPKAFSDLIVRLLSRDPELRPDSAQEVVDAIVSIEDDLASKPKPAASDDSMLFGDLQDDTDSSIPTRRVESKSKSPSSRGTLVAIGGGALVLIVASLIAYVALRKKEQPANVPAEIVKEEPKEKEVLKKGRLDRPIDERERNELKVLSIKEQVSRVSDDLARWNRGFNPKRENAIRVDAFGSSAIKLIEIETGSLDDLTPLRALPELSQVVIRGNLKPIKLKGLAKLPLRLLEVSRAEIDLAELGDMPTLVHLDLTGSTIKGVDLVKKYPLESLSLSQTGSGIGVVSGITTLRKLDVSGLKFESFEPIKGLKLESLDFRDCENVKQIDALAAMPLISVKCTFLPSYAKVLKEHKTLRTINDTPRDEYFKD